MNELEQRIVARVQTGFPLVDEPYQQMAGELAMSEEQLLAILRQMQADGRIRRIGLVPNHYALGIEANGMVVWDVPDDQVSEVGRRMGQQPEVSHCYRRPRRLPEWPYNLFCMVHGRNRAEVLERVEHISLDLGIAHLPHEVLFSTRMLKKSGVRLVSERSLEQGG